MFYPCPVDLSDASRVRQAVVCLTPAESKRLLAKCVAGLPEVKKAYKDGRLSVSNGTTCAFVLQELTGEKVSPFCYSVGFIAGGMLSQSLKDDREVARFFVKGERVTQDAFSFLDTFEKGDVVIKGGNAVDAYGNAGVLVANNQSGTVGALQSLIASRGLPVIMPVGLEKSIPCVGSASAGWGQLSLSRSMGLPVALFPMTQSLVITEIQALGLMAGVRGRLVAAGGIGGSEGSVVVLLEGYEDDIDKAWSIVEKVKGEPNVVAPRHHYCPAD
jgi:hypothetical protein